MIFVLHQLCFSVVQKEVARGKGVHVDFAHGPASSKHLGEEKISENEHKHLKLHEHQKKMVEVRGQDVSHCESNC